MKLADILRQNSLTNRQNLDNKTIISIVKKIKTKAIAAAEHGDRQIKYDHNDLNLTSVKKRVKELLEGFSVHFYVDQHEYNDGITPTCGYIAYYIQVV